MSERNIQSSKPDSDTTALKLQLIELDGRMDALWEKYKRDRTNLRYLALQLAIGIASLLFLLYLIIAPYASINSLNLPYFLDVLASFLVVIIGYWNYQTYVKLRLYSNRKEQINEVRAKVQRIKSGAEDLLAINEKSTHLSP